MSAAAFAAAVASLAVGTALLGVAAPRVGRAATVYGQAATVVVVAWAALSGPVGASGLAAGAGGGAALVLVSLVGLAASAYHAGTRRRAAGVDGPSGEDRRWNAGLPVFVGAALIAMGVADPIGSWMAIEATGAVAAFLLLGGGPRELEAAWKLYLASAAGALVALLGILVAASGIRPDLALALMAIGFGAKAGLVPLYAWKPDAYAVATPPFGALLSGVETTAALAVIQRWDARLAAGSPSPLLLAIGVVTLALAAATLVAQRDARRALAFSTVAEAGLAVVAMALGAAGAGIAGLLVLGHAVAKPLAFFTVEARGRLLWLFAVAVLALAGMPPFYGFFAEVALIAAAFRASPWLGVGLVGATLAVSAGLLAMLSAQAPWRAAAAERPVASAEARVAVGGIPSA